MKRVLRYLKSLCLLLMAIVSCAAPSFAQRRMPTPPRSAPSLEVTIPPNLWTLYTSTINEVSLNFWLPFGFERLPKLMRNLLVDQAGDLITLSEQPNQDPSACPTQGNRGDSVVMSIQITRSQPIQNQWLTEVHYIGCSGNPAFVENFLVCSAQPTHLSAAEILSGQRSFAPQAGESCRRHSFFTGQGQEFFSVDSRFEKSSSWISTFSSGGNEVLRLQLLNRFLTITPLDLIENLYADGRYLGPAIANFSDFFLVATQDPETDLDLRYFDNQFTDLSKNEFEARTQVTRTLVTLISRDLFLKSRILGELPDITETALAGSNRAFIQELEQLINQLRLGGTENIDRTIEQLEGLIFATEQGQFIPQDLRPQR